MPKTEDRKKYLQKYITSWELELTFKGNSNLIN